MNLKKLILNLLCPEVIFIKIPSILIVSIPFLLITGPLLSDLAISICSIIFLINYFLNKELKKYFKNKIFYIYLIFCAYLIFNSIIISEEILFSLKNSLFYFRFGIFSICVWYVLENNLKLIKYVFYSILLCFLILVFDGFIQYYLGKNIFGWELYPGPRISSFFGDELIYGSYLSRLLPVLFAFMILNIEKKIINKKIQYLTFLIFILSDIAVFLSGERTAFFFINLGAILFISSSINYKIPRAFIFGFSTFIILLLSFLGSDAKERIFDRTVNEMNITKSENSNSQIYIFSKTHHEHYISATKMFLDNPFFGVGYKNFRFACSDDRYLISVNSCTTHPHNIYLQLLSETGVIGFFFVSFLFCIIIYKFSKQIIVNIFYKNNKKYLYNDFEVCLIIAIIISIWPFAPSGNIFNNWLSIISFYPLGFLIWSLNNKTKKIN